MITQHNVIGKQGINMLTENNIQEFEFKGGEIFG